MLGVIVNTIAVILGSTIGLIFKKGIPDKMTQGIMTGIGLCTLYIGVSGSLKGENVLVVILSMVLGAIVGIAIDIDGRINGLADWIANRMPKKEKEEGSIAEGFVTASLLFCIGAMTIVGSLNAGLLGDNEMLFTKSLLDLISSILLSVSLGIGVLFSAAFVFLFQGSIVLLAGFLEPILSASAIAEITCVGSLMIIALGFNIIGIAKIKVANYLPAIFFVPLVCWIFEFLPI